MTKFSSRFTFKSRRSRFSLFVTMWDAIEQVFLLTIKLNIHHLLPLNYFLRLAFLFSFSFMSTGYAAFCTFPLQHLGHQLQPFLGEKPCKEEVGCPIRNGLNSLRCLSVGIARMTLELSCMVGVRQPRL